MRACALLIGLLMFLAVARGDEDSVQADHSLPVITTIDGMKLDEAALKDKVIVVEFWATWCAQCLNETPHLKKLFDRYDQDQVVFIGVAEETDVDVVKKYVQQHEIPWHVAMDSEQALARQYKVKGLPGALIFDGDQKLVWQGSPRDMDQPLRDAVKQ